VHIQNPKGFLSPWGFIFMADVSRSAGRKETSMGRKLYVGNLSYAVTKEMLEELFGKVGKVESVNIVTDRYSGQSRGFGFVEMANPNEANEAIKQLNGQTVADRQIIVNEATSDGKKGGDGGGRRFGGGGGGKRRY
jgi:RNA recognition motif-containing protein